MRALIAASTLLLLGSIGLLFPGETEAHAPQAGTSDATAWSSAIPHNSTAYVQLMSSLRGYTNMVSDYNNARGHLNDETDSGVVANPPFTDVVPPNTPTPRVLIVEAGSAEETYINAVVGFSACSSSTAWGKVYAMNLTGASPHRHTYDQKVCIWPGRFSRTATNGAVPDVRYQYLTLQHELGHVLNLAHPTDDHSALMRDGFSMLELNVTERDAVRTHY